MYGLLYYKRGIRVMYSEVAPYKLSFSSKINFLKSTVCILIKWHHKSQLLYICICNVCNFFIFLCQPGSDVART